MNLKDINIISNDLQNDFDDFWNTNILKEELKANNRKYIVAKSNNGEILGFAGILINVDCAEIMNIVVRKKDRHKGIGQSLLENLINIAKQHELDFITLEVNEKNENAIKLYEKNGFKKVGIRPKYYNEDSAIIMKLF